MMWITNAALKITTNNETVEYIALEENRIHEVQLQAVKTDAVFNDPVRDTDSNSFQRFPNTVWHYSRCSINICWINQCMDLHPESYCLVVRRQNSGPFPGKRTKQRGLWCLYLQSQNPSAFISGVELTHLATWLQGSVGSKYFWLSTLSPRSSVAQRSITRQRQKMQGPSI